MSNKVHLINEAGHRIEVEDSNLEEAYQLNSIEELMEYMWLRPKITHLNVDIFVDDGLSYIRNKHKLLLFVRNGYDKNINEFIPFLVSTKPIILNNIINLQISSDDILSVKNFIISNLEILQSLANKNISQQSFVQSICNKHEKENK
jgi:hypothetical protein